MTDQDDDRHRWLGKLMASRPGDAPPDLADLLAELAQRPDWHAHAACRGMGTDAFFPVRGQSLGPALETCDICTVKAECLAADLAHLPVNRHGIWGGTSAKARRKMTSTDQAA